MVLISKLINYYQIYWNGSPYATKLFRTEEEALDHFTEHYACGLCREHAEIYGIRDSACWEQEGFSLRTTLPDKELD